MSPVLLGRSCPLPPSQAQFTKSPCLSMGTLHTHNCSSPWPFAHIYSSALVTFLPFISVSLATDGPSNVSPASTSFGKLLLLDFGPKQCQTIALYWCPSVPPLGHVIRSLWDSSHGRPHTLHVRGPELYSHSSNGPQVSNGQTLTPSTARCGLMVLLALEYWTVRTTTVLLDVRNPLFLFCTWSTPSNLLWIL